MSESAIRSGTRGRKLKSSNRPPSSCQRGGSARVIGFRRGGGNACAFDVWQSLRGGLAVRAVGCGVGRCYRLAKVAGVAEGVSVIIRCGGVLAAVDCWQEFGAVGCICGAGIVRCFGYIDGIGCASRLGSRRVGCGFQ